MDQVGERRARHCPYHVHEPEQRRRRKPRRNRSSSGSRARVAPTTDPNSAACTRTTTRETMLPGATSAESCSERMLLSERNRQLLREELAKQEQCRRKYIEITLGAKAGGGRPPRRTCRQRLAFYASSSLALVAISGTCALLFLVPLYVDPALSTLGADFAPQPVACTTQRRDELWGLLNCTWSSCREGCTSEMYRCTHIHVTYSPSGFLNETDGLFETKEPQEPLVDAVLLVNIKGCGYPPQVDCENFTRLWGSEGTRFPCYYSRVNRSVVLAEYDRQAELDIVWNYLALPLALTVSTTSLLCVWHCDCSCPPPRPRRNRARYNLQQGAPGSSRASSRPTSSAAKRPPPRNDISEHSISSRVERRGHPVQCECGEVIRPL